MIFDYFKAKIWANFGVRGGIYIDMFYFFSHPQSLHYLSPDGANQYTQAIQSVGEIIEPYDTDKQFPALGFGAKVPPHGQVSFEFFLNLAQNPYCNGVQGILQAYRTALGQVLI